MFSPGWPKSREWRPIGGDRPAAVITHIRPMEVNVLQPQIVPALYRSGVCNRARNRDEPETLRSRWDLDWVTPTPMDGRFNPVELAPKTRAYVIRRNDRGLGLDVMSWDILGGETRLPTTDVRHLGLPQWRRVAERPENRCLIPLTEFAEWTRDKIDLGDGKPAIKGEMWFRVTDQPTFAVAGFWQPAKDGPGFTMVTCEPNELVAPIHPKAMVTILAPEDHERWLAGSYEDVIELQRPYPAAHMTVRGPEFPTRQVTEGTLI
jgi:putative SOS response-associated peptidase YedK